MEIREGDIVSIKEERIVSFNAVAPFGWWGVTSYTALYAGIHIGKLVHIRLAGGDRGTYIHQSFLNLVDMC